MKPTKTPEVIRRFVVMPDGEEAKTGKALSQLVEIIDDKLAVNTLALTKRTGQLALRVGQVYDIPTQENEDGKLVFVIGAKKYVGQYEDNQKVLQWQMTQRGLEDARAAARLEKRVATDDSELMKHVGYIKEAYRQMTKPKRDAFDAWLLTELHKGLIF